MSENEWELPESDTTAAGTEPALSRITKDVVDTLVLNRLMHPYLSDEKPAEQEDNSVGMEWVVESTNYTVEAEADEDTYEVLDFVPLPDGWINLSHSRERLSTCPGVLKIRYPANDFDAEKITYEAAAFGERGLGPAWKVHEGLYASSTYKSVVY